MARRLNLLTARQVETLNEPGRHADGGGLYLRVNAAGARSWVFMTASNGKRIEIGLGSAKAVRLVQARQWAGEMREAVARGEDPRNVLAKNVDTAEASKVITFGQFAEESAVLRRAGRTPSIANSGDKAYAITPAH